MAEREKKPLTEEELLAKNPKEINEEDVKAFITREMDHILDIPLEVSAELGRTELPVHEILKLDEGSVVELSKLVGEPMEILINGLLTARGEVVVVNERFGVRVTDVIDPMEMVRMYKM
ncbi:MAG: flagellar motor switch protein FliN [Nitrospinae bacterium]|nr:flagellar motor switch protein FliN [Nitrospinota bacterium]